nr:hypothetical protein GCM10020092_090800 [Actinoplanes digitatis]
MTWASRHCRSPSRRRLADPVEDRAVVVVHPELALAGAPRPGVLTARVERGPGQVEAGAVDLGLQPGEYPQGLRVALEAAAGLRGRVQGRLAVVPERRVADVVREARHVHHVGVTAQPGAHLAGDLRDLERVRQPRTQKVVRPGRVHLGLGGEPAEPGRVQHPGPVALELGAAVAAVLGGLVRPAQRIAVRHVHTLRRRPGPPMRLV